jgi:drug/metabolite transporter (DMT)-like permease
MAGGRSEVDGATLGAFAAVVVVGGANYIAVKDTVDELDPLYGAAMRFGFACLIFFVILAARRIPLPRGQALAGAAIYGLLGFGTAYALLYIALVELSAGVASVLMATVPLLTLALAAAQRTERITARGLVGGALAIGGIAVLSVHSRGVDVPFRYLLAALVAPLAVAQSTIVAKRFPRTDPIATNAVGMLAGTVLLLVASLAWGESWTVPEARATWLAVAWLVVAGSVGMFWLFLLVIRRWTASAASYALPLMPVVAVGLDAGLNGEAIGPEVIAAGLLVIAGVYVGALRGSRAEAPEAAPSASAAR